MPKRKVLIIISAVFVVSAILLALVFFMNSPNETAQNQPMNTGGLPSHNATDKTSSQFGEKVSYPNDYEGQVQTTTLSSYVIGQYKSEYDNYSDMLAKSEVSRKMAGVIDPSLTAARDKFPKAQVSKGVYNGFMTISVDKYEGRRHTYDGPSEDGMEPYYGDPVYALNFDLHTGEQVDLRAVFSDNFDAQTAVNKAVQPYVLALDEQNIRKFKGIDLHNTNFTLDKNGVWLIFDEKSPFLTNQSIYIEWYKFGEGAIAVFDRFAPLSKSEISSDYKPDFLNQDFRDELIFRSEPKYLVKQNTFFYLPTDYENDYERQLAEKVKKFMLSIELYESSAGFDAPVMMYNIAFDRIGNYRMVSAGEFSGVFNVKTGKEITPSEYWGRDYEKQFFAHLTGPSGRDDITNKALVSESEFKELLKSAEFDFPSNTITFSKEVKAQVSDDGFEWGCEWIIVPPVNEWWK